MSNEEKILENLTQHIEEVRRFRALLIVAGFGDATPIDATIAYLEMFKSTLEQLIKAVKDKE